MPSANNAGAIVRRWAYIIDPQLGVRFDQALLQRSGLGDGDADLNSALTDITNGLNNIAKTAQISVADYYNAMTSIRQIQTAAGAGMTTQQYAAAQNATASTSNFATANLLGIPLWLLFGGAAVAVVLMKPHRGRR